MDKDKYIGRLLDNRYEILEVIGTGGMAVVYKARCHRLNRLVAVKILKDDNLEDEDFRSRFHAESQAVAMLSHPNIVSVYDVSTSVMADYIVMELIEGITLKQYMEKKGVLNWKETLHFAMQIAKALEHAHSKGIVHRDIKPHNVMVLKNGSVKVMDFGIARMISRGNTLTKEALGSVHYISPEQAKGGRVDNRSDIYSLGVVMYEMMAGRPPYDGESPVSVAIQHINGGAALPSVLNPNIPGGLEQIIMKAMAKNVSDRYPSATRMLSDMDEFRKDPTTLFDYTGLPLDAVMRVQKPSLVLQPQTTAQEKAMQAQGMRNVSRPDVRERQLETRRRNEAQRRRQQEENRSRIAIITIIACSVALMVAIGVGMAFFLGGGFQDDKLLEVPKLTGAEFSKLPEYPGFTIMKEERYDETVAAGVIISQKPEAGNKVVEGSVIVVNVSLGARPNVVTLGNLVERSKNWAESYLNSLQLDLNIAIKEEYNERVAEGYVIQTEPASGTELKQGQTVTLYVSKGKKIQISSMPKVVDEEKDKAVKTLELQELDLDIVIVEQYHATIRAGIVMDTEPGPGEKLKTGDKVTLYVSKGVEKKIMPDVVGMDVTSAASMLSALGFKTPKVVYVDSDKVKDTVLTQSLLKDTEYEITTEITLQVSNASKRPPDVTKDVIIDLKDYTKNGRCRVTISRDGEEVYLGWVEKGAKTITLPDQVGFGKVTFTVLIDPDITWNVVEDFTTSVSQDSANNEEDAANG